MSGIRALLGFERTVADLARTEAFYCGSLDFVREGVIGALPPGEAEILGLSGREVRCLTLRLNRQWVRFLEVDPPGAPYPAERDATDPIFQHFAIPVRDMAAAFARIDGVGRGPISRGGPQVLPASSGGVSAYKFRDPDGHPLELIAFPGGPAAARSAEVPGLFLGIDHSAITVTDLDAALRVLTGPLGLTIAGRGLNRGPEQGRLDGLDAPEVDVIALAPPVPAPHVEVLHYRRPERTRSAATAGPADRGSTRFVVEAEDPGAVAAAVQELGLSVTRAAEGRACFVTGPDGHGFLVRGPGRP